MVSNHLLLNSNQQTNLLGEFQSTQQPVYVCLEVARLPEVIRQEFYS